jgi:hypothetical protein
MALTAYDLLADQGRLAAAKVEFSQAKK